MSLLGVDGIATQHENRDHVDTHTHTHRLGPEAFDHIVVTMRINEASGSCVLVCTDLPFEADWLGLDKG